MIILVMIHALEIKLDIIMQILLILGDWSWWDWAWSMLMLRFCH